MAMADKPIYPAGIGESDIERVGASICQGNEFSFLDDVLQEMRLRLWLDGKEKPMQTRGWYLRQAACAARDALRQINHRKSGQRPRHRVVFMSDLGYEPDGRRWTTDENGEPEAEPIY